MEGRRAEVFLGEKTAPATRGTAAPSDVAGGAISSPNSTRTTSGVRGAEVCGRFGESEAKKGERSFALI